MTDFFRFPRTPHLEGSRPQSGDEDLETIAFADLAGRELVVSEKLDGANCAIHFNRGRLTLQSRGHVLRGGPRERQFNRFKAWAATIADELRLRLTDRYVLFGEWLYARHTVFYDALPHYFIEIDVCDKHDGTFLSTPRRRELLAPAGVVSAPILAVERYASLPELTALLGPSRFKSDAWPTALRQSAIESGADPVLAAATTDPSSKMEGLYIKIEDDERVITRCKFVRGDFVNTLAGTDDAWHTRPIVPNRLMPGVELFDHRAGC